MICDDLSTARVCDGNDVEFWLVKLQPDVSALM